MNIYAGRFQNGYHKMTIPNLFQDIQSGKLKPAEQKTFIQDKAYTVTLSDEGLSSSKALREYAEKNPLSGQFNLEANIEEFNKQLHTCSMDMSNAFISEMDSIGEDLKTTYHLPETTASFDRAVTLAAKEYQIIYNRIEEEFSNPNREITYIQEHLNSERRVEPKEDRIAELDKAYNQYSDYAAGTMQNRAQFENWVHGANYSSLDKIQEKAKQAYMDAIDYKNIKKLEEKVESFEDYKLDFRIEAEWKKQLNSLFSTYKK